MYSDQVNSRCADLLRASSAAQDWINQDTDVIKTGKDRLLMDLRREGRVLKKVSKALSKNMCAAVFGPSQAGKSYLLSALAADKNGFLTADFGGDLHDFIREINPEGGKESTGLVTRFTLKQINGPKGYPVHLSLLTETDLVKIIANSYYCDCEHKDSPDEEAIRDRLFQLEKFKTSEKQSLTLDAMEDLKEYISEEFGSALRVHALKNLFWESACKLAPQLPLEQRIELYSLIWDEIPALTGLLATLLIELKKLNYSEEVFAALDALIPRDQSIIDVALLMPSEDGKGASEVSLRTPDGKEVSVPRWIATALTAELTITMKDKPADFFEVTDLLDFPGYRSRFKFTDIKQLLAANSGQKTSREMFLRGKVAYLFQRYCAERELTSMLLCIGPSNQEVNDLPAVITKWIGETHGKTPEERDRNFQDSLFMVLTKADMDFEEKSGSTDVSSRWDNRLKASLINFFGSGGNTWVNNWKTGKVFNNIFLLRNPNFTWRAMMDFGPNNKETGIQAARRQYVEDMRNAFVNSKLVRRHFKQPEVAWEAMMRLNDGGITHIREALSPLCKPEIKEKQLAATMENSAVRILNSISPFYRSDNKEDEYKKKLIWFAKILKRYKSKDSGKFKSRFWELIRRIGLENEEILDLKEVAQNRYNEFITQKEAADIEEQEKEDEEIDIESLLGDFGEAPEEEAVTASESERDTNYFYAETIIDYWFDRLFAMAKKSENQHYFDLSADEFITLINELQTAVLRMDIKGQLEKGFKEIAAPADVSPDKKSRKQASFAAGLLNNFVSWAAMNPTEHPEPADRTVEVQGKKMVVFEVPTQIYDLPELPEKPEIAVKAEKRYRDWILSFWNLMNGNLDFDGQTTFNREQNKLLGDIIKGIKA